MPKFAADTVDVEGTRNFFVRNALPHLRVRKRGAVLTIESGPDEQPFAHARLRKVTKQYWTLEMPTHSRRWQTTPFRATRLEILELLLQNFPWTLADFEQADRTYDPEV